MKKRKFNFIFNLLMIVFGVGLFTTPFIDNVKKEKADTSITNLIGYKWSANNTPNLSTFLTYSSAYNVDFECDGVLYNKFSVMGLSYPYALFYDNTIVGSDSTTSGFWRNDKYKTIHFLGGDSVTSGSFIFWLNQNGTLEYDGYGAVDFKLYSNDGEDLLINTSLAYFRKPLTISINPNSLDIYDGNGQGGSFDFYHTISGLSIVAGALTPYTDMYVGDTLLINDDTTLYCVYPGQDVFNLLISVGDDIFDNLSLENLYINVVLLNSFANVKLATKDNDDNYVDFATGNFNFLYSVYYNEYEHNNYNLLVDSADSRGYILFINYFDFVNFDSSFYFKFVFTLFDFLDNEFYLAGYQDGYTLGYNTGYTEGFGTDRTISAIFSGILQIGLLPINFFLSIFNFEILGVNISGFISALLSVCITIIVIRVIKGSKDD